MKEEAKYIQMMCAAAHEKCMGCGLKNTPDLISEVKGDVQFYVNEDCVKGGNCNLYAGSKKPIYHIEYVEGKHITNRAYTSDSASSSCKGGSSSGPRGGQSQKSGGGRQGQQSSDRRSGSSFLSNFRGKLTRGRRGRRLSRRAEQVEQVEEVDEAGEVGRAVGLINDREFCPDIPRMLSRLAVLDLTGETMGCCGGVTYTPVR